MLFTQNKILCILELQLELLNIENDGRNKKLHSLEFFFQKMIFLDKKQNNREIWEKLRKKNVEASVRVLRAETRLTVYRSPYIGDFPVERASILFDVFFSISIKFS